ncbi:NAD(P)/FAD-dependent oxidoreductase [Vibrio natriegens]|uniref:NAD(P)/FAD-dependent oxidoreductase n=1 Tax=Vibrio natriegens TaxID=691 RepID=UPI0009C188AB|nr:FAD-binding oxidoreductase [Vibrio natriegens]
MNMQDKDTSDDKFSLWQNTGGQPIETKPLSGDIKTDVVIIGAGFTGNSAALHLAESGVDVCVLESKYVGYGGSGRNTGLVNAGLWTPPDDIERIFGQKEGQKLNQALTNGPELVFGLVKKHGIDCDAVNNGTLHLAHNASVGKRDLLNRYNQQVARNAPVTLLNAEETRVRTGANHVHGALFDPRAGTIHPLKYVRGLARAAMKAGAKLYQETPAEDIKQLDDGTWKVSTPNGSVTAKYMIVATHAYETRQNQPKLYTPFFCFSCATGPLDESLTKDILPNNEGTWDTAEVMSWFRKDVYGRVMVGSVGKLDDWGKGVHINWARRKMKQWFPQLANEPFEHAWFGRIMMTSDHLPKVVHLGKNAVMIYGYNGRGIATGSVFGKAAAEWIKTDDYEAFPLPLSAHKFESYTGLRSNYYVLGSRLLHSVNNRF